MKTYFFVLLILTISSAALACRCDPTVNLALKANPEKALVAFIGRLDGDAFKVEKTWTRAKASYDLDRKSSCRVFLEPGVRYLVLGSNENGLRQCQTVFQTLADAGETIAKLATKKSVSPLASNPSYFYCQNNNECQLTLDPCGSKTAVSKNFLKEYDTFSKELGRVLSCVQPKVRKVKAACENYLCSAKPD